MKNSQSIPRPEYPRPQFVRTDWINLNGTWTFTFDHSKSGADRGLKDSKGFCDTILVPFCPESKISGVGYTDFIEQMWYHRKISIPSLWKNKHIILHFGAVDYECEAFVDGVSAGRHWGGSISFWFDITKLVKTGSMHNLVVVARDNTRSGLQPGGKQSPRSDSFGCMYTRTTGIWQTVWLEGAAYGGFESCVIIPDFDQNQFSFIPRYFEMIKGNRLQITCMQDKKAVGEVDAPVSTGVPVVMPIKSPRAWSPEDPFLYDLKMEIRNTKGEVIDTVSAYAGMRKIHCQGNKIFLNNKPLYLRLVLDQGFYPDGIWTAPSDAALKRDILLSMQAGFNGARLHQKVFEERFHYWADKLGYLTWGEFASWGIDPWNSAAIRNFASEWKEVVMRDQNHPSIIAWTPFNETWRPKDGKGKDHDRAVQEVYDLTRMLDPTRPVNDTSGYYHVKTDLYTVHTYEQDSKKLARQLRKDSSGHVFRNYPDHEAPYAGQPYLVDEFGGIKWIPPSRRPNAKDSWGYGNAPMSEKELFSRLKKLVDVILKFKHIAGYCYTQLTDVEQEQNGIYNYDRTTKFNMKKIKAIFSKEQ